MSKEYKYEIEEPILGTFNFVGNIHKVASRSILQKATTSKLPSDSSEANLHFYSRVTIQIVGANSPHLHFDLRNTLNLDFEKGKALGKVKMSPPVNLLSLSQWQDNPMLLREFC